MLRFPSRYQAAGALTGTFIGCVKAKFGANGFPVGMTSTHVVSALTDYLLRTSLQETKAEYLQTDGIPKAAHLPKLIRGTLTIFRRSFNVPARLGVPYSKED